MESIIASFVNYSFTIGEWLIKEKIISSDDIEEMDATVLIGIPSLAVLHCIEKTSNFDDEFIYLATGKKLDPATILHLPDVYKTLFQKILEGSKLYIEIGFNYDTYDKFRENIIKSHNEQIEFDEKCKALRTLLYGIALEISQIDEYKQKFANVLELLQTMANQNEKYEPLINLNLHQE